MSAVLFVVITLASYRLWRIPGRDTWPPAETFRAWLDETAPDWVSELVTCPWCLGFYVSGLVVLVVDVWFVGLAMPVLWWLAVSCGVGLIGSNLDG